MPPEPAAALLQKLRRGLLPVRPSSCACRRAGASTDALHFPLSLPLLYFRPSIFPLPLHTIALLQIFLEHVSRQHGLALRALDRTLGEVFRPFPELLRVLAGPARQVLARQRAAAEQRVREMLQWEQELTTQNHYFTVTVQKLRQALMPKRYGEDAGAAAGLVSGSSGESKGADAATEGIIRDELGKLVHGQTVTDFAQLSIEEARAVDLQIEIFAYWKTMRKRLVDYVALCCRGLLLRAPLDELLPAVLQEELERVAGSPGLLPLMRCPRDLAARRELQQRLQALREAETLATDTLRTSSVSLAQLRG